MAIQGILPSFVTVTVISILGELTNIMGCLVIVLIKCKLSIIVGGQYYGMIVQSNKSPHNPSK